MSYRKSDSWIFVGLGVCLTRNGRRQQTVMVVMQRGRRRRGEEEAGGWNGWRIDGG